MDTDLVIRAQGGDQEAFADLVYAIADRFLAVSHRIFADAYLVASAERTGIGVIASFDRSIDRVTTVRREEPA